MPVTIARLKQLFEQRSDAQYQIDTAIQSANEAIRNQYPRMAPYRNLRLIELVLGCDSQGNDAVHFRYEYFDGTDTNHLTHVIPVEIVVKGYHGTLAYLDEQKRLREEQSQDMGRRREVAQRAARFTLYKQLMKEFEGQINLEAIVKVTNEPICPKHNVSYVMCICQDGPRSEC